MPYAIVGLSHKTSPIGWRERFAFTTPVQIERGLKRLLTYDEIEESLILSTCNRVEFCLFVKHLLRGSNAAREVLATIADPAPENLEEHFYQKGDEEAIGHLFRVASGLDSMVLGEPQIAGQLKEAYTFAVAQKATGPYLNKLVHQSLRVSKRVRTETEIGRYPVSVSYTAVVLATKIFEHLWGKKILVLGAGETGELVARHLREREVSRIFFINRTVEKAHELAKTFGGEVRTLGELEKTLVEVDIVISSVQSPSPILRAVELQRVLSARRGRPLLVIDLGVPRNIEPGVNKLDNVYLYDIDALQGIAEANQRWREKETGRAEEIIREEVGRFIECVKGMEMGPAIEALTKKYELVRLKELARFFSRYPHLRAEVGDDLERCTSAIVSKILHEPIVLAKKGSGDEESVGYGDWLKRMFKLEI